MTAALTAGVNEPFTGLRQWTLSLWYIFQKCLAGEWGQYLLGEYTCVFISVYH